MDIIASIRARALNYKARHFDRFPEGKRLKSLQKIHAGSRCFIVGNGPSLTAADLNRLEQNGEISFAFNRIYHIFDQTTWRPTYYISQDEKMLAGSMSEVSALKAGQKFIPAEMRWYMDIDVPGAQTFHIVNRDIDDLPDFSDNIAREVINSKTVVYTAAQFAVYMGITEIYLIGVDHHFRVSRNNAGEIMLDNSVKDYFTDRYNEDKEKLYIPNTEKSTLTYVAMKRHCEERGIRVFNATRGGKLEVFPRVRFDDLFDA